MTARTRCMIACLAACIAAPPASAFLPEVSVVNYRTLSAASCRATSSDAQLRLYSAPRLRNLDAQSRGVVCPISFDASKDRLGARVEVSGDVGAVRCRLSVRHRSGSTTYSSWRYLSGLHYGSTTNGYISIPSQSLPSTSSANLECILPGVQQQCSSGRCTTLYSEIKALRISESEQ